MHLYRLTLFCSLFLLPHARSASTNKNANGSCSQSHNQLLTGTYELVTDCDDTKYCDASGVCKPKGCRRDEFPLGYAQDASLPPRCKEDEFCPDEGDQCQSLLPVGSPCQLNRDDQCAPPPNAHDLADKNFNHNGSVCINFQCMWSNVTQGQPCVVEQMPYIAYGPGSSEFIYVVSRGNCRTGLYCDAANKACMQTKSFAASCTADKECQSNNCMSTMTCGNPPQAPKQFGMWVYVVVGLGILFAIIGTLVGLYLLHRRTREQEREKRTQYWREQHAFRQNILQMRDTAKASLLSLSPNGSGVNTPRSTIYSGREHSGSVDSAMPMLRRSSGLRLTTSDDDGQDSIHGETPMTIPAEYDVGGWSQRSPTRTHTRKLSKVRR